MQSKLLQYPNKRITIQNQIQYITISNDIANQRIDNFLLTYLKNIPKNMVYRIIRKGEVRINKGRIKPEYKIKINDIIRIPPIKQKHNQQNISFVKLNSMPVLTNNIIYEDKYLLVLNKPSGIAVHGGSGIKFGVIEVLRALRPKTCFLELVHRLDRETSGALLIAKKRLVLKLLHQQMRLNQVQKHYIALVKGQWPLSTKVIQAPLLKNILQNGERTVKVVNNGKYSETHFKIKEYFSNATLVKIKPITGRTHQIRVHTQYAKHPVALDKRYGDLSFNQQLANINLKRLFLHANSLKFIHPVNKKKLIFKIPLDQQLKNCLAKLRSNKL